MRDQKPTLEDHVETLNEVIFGNPKTGEKGMKSKVDEMHEMLIQAKGLRGFLYVIIAIGGAAAILKGWFVK
jgi:hypothetical protein